MSVHAIAARTEELGRIVRFPTERREARRLVDVAEGMPAHRWGRRLRFDVVEVERWMDAAGRTVGE
jgi:hypothetical protein